MIGVKTDILTCCLTISSSGSAILPLIQVVECFGSNFQHVNVVENWYCMQDCKYT